MMLIFAVMACAHNGDTAEPVQDTADDVGCPPHDAEATDTQRQATPDIGPTYSCLPVRESANTFIRIESEADAQAFCQDHNRAVGTLWTTDVSVPCLCSTGGDLSLRGVSDLNFPNLRHVGGDLEIVESSITSFEGLEKLESAQNVVLLDLPDLTSLQGWSLETLWTLSITLTGLETLAGLGALTTVTKLELDNNPQLRCLAGLDNLTTARELVIVNNQRLTSLGALQGLQPWSGRRLALASNGIRSIAPFGGGETFSGALWLREDNLTDLAELRDVHTIGSLGLSGTSPDNVDDLRNLRTVNETLAIHNTALTTLEPLRVESAREVHVSGTRLTSLDGLEGIRTVQAGLTIASNDELTDVTAMHGMTRVVGLRIEDNPELGNEAAYELRDSIGTIRRYVWIMNN
jgi:hypothetical protein